MAKSRSAPTPSREASRERRHRLQLQRRAARAKAALGARTAFVAATSHELREPMNGVIGMLRLLLDSPLTTEQHAWAVTALDSAESLLTVVNDLVDLVRIDTNRLDLASLDFDLPNLVRRVADTLAPKAAAKGIALAVDVQPRAPRLVRGDPGRVRQVLLNLVGNAVKFTEHGGVSIRLGGTGGVARIEVADTGPGIESSLLAMLGKGAITNSPALLRRYGGSGLGLAISTALVERMGGSLRLTSRKGHGTRAHAEVPLALGGSAGAGSTPPVSLAGRRLLVADREGALRERLAEAAVGWGLEVRSAATSTAALAFLREAAAEGRPFDVAVLDRDLPDQGAVAIAQAWRADTAGAATQLVMLASVGLRGDAAQTEAAGFQAYLPRPLPNPVLLACLVRLMGGAGGPGLVTRHGLAEPVDVLIADDNPVNIKLASLVLSREGHRVQAAEDGVQAVDAVRSGDFSVVLMDVQMPRLDGLDATRRIRSLRDRKRASVPIVALTADAMAEDQAKCLNAGMDDYLTKPFDRTRLVGTVTLWAERHRTSGLALTLSPPAPGRRAPSSGASRNRKPT